MPEQTISSIDTSIYTSNKAYGGKGGSTFVKERALQGQTVTRIQGWEGRWQLRGLKIWFSDGDSFMFGDDAESPTPIFSFEPGETLIELKFYDSPETSSGGYHRSGGFRFQTNKGRTFKATSQKSPGREYYTEVGSGPLCGVFGRGGADIDCLGFAMLRPVQSAVLVDVKYPGLETLEVTTPPTQIDKIDYTNNTSSVQSLTLSGTKEVQTKISWSTSTSLELSYTFSVTAGIPIVGEVSSELSWMVGLTSTYERDETRTETKTYDFPITCMPHTRIEAQAIIYDDKISTNYEAEVTYNLDSGKVIKYHVNGIYNGLSVRGVDVDINETPIE